MQGKKTPSLSEYQRQVQAGEPVIIDSLEKDSEAENQEERVEEEEEVISGINQSNDGSSIKCSASFQIPCFKTS